GCHPMGALSPFLRTLPLDRHGLRWIRPRASVAHPLDDRPAVLLRKSLYETSRELDRSDEKRYHALFEPFLEDPHGLLADLLGPLRWPAHPWLMARFGLPGLLPASVALRAFRGMRARALLAGCAAHAILPLEKALTTAVAMIFALTAHVEDWPVAEGGSQAI